MKTPARLSMTLAICAMFSANAVADDPYVESAGTSGIDTGCYLTPNSRLEIDFALTTTNGAAQWRVFGSDSVNTSLKAEFYVTGSATWGAIVGNGVDDQQALWLSDGTDFIPADTERHRAVFDIPGDSLSFMTAGETVWTRATGLASFTKGATMPVTLFARYSSAAMTAFSERSKARIYGLRIYESGALAHDFEPCLKDGLAGFRDRVTGDFVTNGGAFTSFSAGGDYATYESPYVATPSGNSAVYIQTGYVATSNTCVELDCSFIDNPPTAGKEWYLFAGAGGNNHFRSFISSGYGYYATVNGANQKLADSFVVNSWTSMAGVRRTFVTDEYNRRTCVMTAGVTNSVKDDLPVSTQNGTKSGLHLASNWNHTGNFSPLKIYGCKIYESGVLVRDFAPCIQDGVVGLRDALTGLFVSYPPAKERIAGSSQLDYGGDILVKADPYIESSGQNGPYIVTDYQPCGVTRAEIDFASLDTSTQTYPFSIHAGNTLFSFGIYAYASTQTFGYNCKDGGPNWTHNGMPTQTLARITLILDAKNGKYIAAEAGGAITNKIVTMTTTRTAATRSQYFLPVFATRQNSDANPYPADSRMAMRLYSFRLYENDVLVRDYAPAVVDGVAGLQDVLPGGQFLAPATGAFTYGGVFTPAVTPGSAAASHGTPATLTATAPGAASYRWLRNGEPIEGGANGTLSVAYRSRVESDTFQAIAVYAFDAATAESEPSAAVTVEYVPSAFTLIVR